MPFRRCETHGHALIDLDDDDGEPVTLRVPWEHRHTSIGWGPSTRIKWKGRDGVDRAGLEESRGPSGILVRDEWGGQHALPHGSFQEHTGRVALKKGDDEPNLSGRSQWVKDQHEAGKKAVAAAGKDTGKLQSSEGGGDTGPLHTPKPDAAPAPKKEKKVHPPIKAGQRWITLHPNGKDEKGVAVLIEPQPDGTARVVSGAGGSLNYLRLHKLKSPEELAKTKSAKAKARRDTERDRRAGMTPEARESEDKDKETKRTAIKDHERKIIETIREKVGGIDDDHDPEELKAYPKNVREKLVNAKHREQFRQAMAIRKDIAEHLATNEIENLKDREAMGELLRSRPDLYSEAQEEAHATLALLDEEKKERAKARKMLARPNTARPEKVADAARETAESDIGAFDREKLTEELDKRGGAIDQPGATLADKGDEEMRRRSTQARLDARILLDAARGNRPSSEASGREVDVITTAIRKAGLGTDATADEVQDALAHEAALQYRRAQIFDAKAELFAKEEQSNPGIGLRKIAASDLAEGLTHAVADAARKLGIRSRDRIPLRDVDVADLHDVLRDTRRLEDMAKELEECVSDAETPGMDRARLGFELAVGEPPASVLETVQEEVLHQLGDQLRGLALEHRPAYARAVADGHYARLADVSLALTKENFVDRTTLDAIGPRNAAILTRHAMTEAGVDPKRALDALVTSHIRDQKELTTKALRAADAFVPHVSDLVDGHPDDMEDAMRQLDASEADLDDVQRQVGSAIGHLETNATLAQAFRSKVPDRLTVDVPGGDALGQVRWLNAIGLEAGDYEIEPDQTAIHIKKEAWSKLIHRESADVVEKRKTMDAVKKGKFDEDDWMPAGMVRRPSDWLTDPPKGERPVPPPLDLDAHDLRGSMVDHVGARLLAGERPGDISADLLSARVTAHAANPDAWRDTVRELFPVYTDADKAQLAKNKDLSKQYSDALTKYREAEREGDPDTVTAALAHLSTVDKPTPVKEKRDTDFQEHYEKLIAEHQKRKGVEPKTGTGSVHTRSLYDGADPNQIAEAVHQVVTAKPHLKAAFLPLGELDNSARRAIQAHFYDKAGIGKDRSWQKEFDGERDALIAKLKTKGADEPTGGGMFGGGAMFGSPAPSKPAEELTADNLARLHPKEAKALAERYPREGRHLFAAAHGERPEDDAAALEKLTPAMREAVTAEMRERPTHDMDALVQRATERAALNGAGATREQMEARIPGWQQLSQQEIDSGHHLTPAARKLSGKVGMEAAGHKASLNREALKKAVAGQMHDAERARYEALLKRAGSPWSEAVDFAGGVEHLYGSLQADMRGDFNRDFAKAHERVTGKPLTTTLEDIPGVAGYHSALAAPKEREALAAKRRAEIAAVRTRARAGETEDGARTGGRYQGGSALEAFRAEQEAQRTIAARQGGLFGGPSKTTSTAIEAAPAREEPKTEAMGERRLDVERTHIGERAESEVSDLLRGSVGQNIDPMSKTTVKLRAGNDMSGPRVYGQRMIRAMQRGMNRLGVFLGTGTGKTSAALGAFTQMHADGKATHALILGPKAVQDQFAGEGLQMLEPGKFKLRTGEGLSHDERVAMLRDKDTHIRVLTHQSAADTFLQLAADHHGVAPEVMLEKLRGMSLKERGKTMAEVLEHHGIPKPLAVVDESHVLTTQAGQKETKIALVLKAVTHPLNTTHALYATATPHKNNASEIADKAGIIDPDQHGDRYKFSQAFGEGSIAAPDALRRELDHLTITGSTKPDIERADAVNPEIAEDGRKVERPPLALHPEVEQRIAGIHKAYDTARAALKEGRVDLEAMRTLSPERFAGLSDEEGERVASRNALSLASLRDTGIRKAINSAPIEHNPKLRGMVDVIKHDLAHGRHALVFSNWTGEGEHIQAALAKEGITASMYHGGLTGSDRQKWKHGLGKKFQIGILSASGEAGLNVQDKAAVLHNYDIPITQKSWTQRAGRVDRQGQTEKVEVHDWHTDSDYDRSAIRRLKVKSQVAGTFEDTLGAMDETGIAGIYNAGRQEAQAHADVPPPVLPPG